MAKKEKVEIEKVEIEKVEKAKVEKEKKAKKPKKEKKVISQKEALKKVKRTSKLAMAIGGVFMVAAVAGSALSIKTFRSQLDVTMALEQFAMASRELTFDIQSYAVTGNTEYLDAYNKELKDDKNRENAMKVLEENDLTDDEKKAFDEIQALSKKLEPLEEEAIKLVAAGNTAGATAVVFGEEYEHTSLELVELTEKEINSIKERLSSEESIYVAIQWVSLILFVISVAYLISQLIKTHGFAEKQLLAPIIKASKQMECISSGDFSHETDMQEDDSEVGVMVKSMNKMKTNTHNIITEIASVLDEMGNGNYIVSTQAEYVGEYETIEVSIEKIIDKMRETFHTIKNVSEQIDAGSEQLACAAQDLAEGCTTQATQVSGVVAAMQEMSASMELNAADAEVSVELSTEAGRILMEGNQKMSELAVAIEEISKCSEQIGTIISTIQDIADQTNLLSLNAAIEAARAGEAGRGFAVVAEQVKNLAEESAIAAGRTTTLIETTIEAVGKGILIAGETAADMARVMESAKLATDKMNAIAIKLKSDNEKVQKINETMTIVTEVVTDNSAASEETAAVSEEQKAQVETMVELMTQFNV